MRNLLIINILLFSTSFSFSNNLNDTVLSVYDLLLLKSKIDNDEKLLVELNNKIIFYQNQINQNKISINVYNKTLEIYSDLYADLLKNIYLILLQLKSPKLFVFSADSFSKAFYRYNYLQLLLNYLKKLNQFIKLTQQKLINESLSYENYVKSLDIYIKNYQTQKVDIENNLIIALNSANILQQKANDIRIIINNDYNTYLMLNDYFLKLPYSLNSNNSEKIEKKFNAPLYNSVVISSFGTHNHPYLKNITVVNDGIDLYSKTDTLVKSIADAKVIAIVNLPNYGHSVILKHDNYYSVYSNLNLIYVSQNQQILNGFVIGSVSKSTSKYSYPCLNLQIWYNTEKLNPVEYLNLN